MRKAILLTLLVVAVTIPSACINVDLGDIADMNVVEGSGEVTDEIRDVGSFSRIDVSNGFRAEVTVGDEPSLVVIADDNLMELISTTVEGDTLVAEPTERNTRLKSEAGVVLIITVPALEAASASGGSSVDVTGIRGDDFRASGSGGSQLDLAGTTGALSIDLSGGSQIFAAGLEAENVTLNASGGSQAEVFASESIDADLSGGSRACYEGTPASVRSDTSGGSELDEC